MGAQQAISPAAHPGFEVILFSFALFLPGWDPADVTGPWVRTQGLWLL